MSQVIHTVCLSSAKPTDGGINGDFDRRRFLAALKELQEASLAMTRGKLPSAQEMERHHQAIVWSKRVIALAERHK